MELALWLTVYSWTWSGMESYCTGAFAGVTDVILSSLDEATGLNPISSVTVLRNQMSNQPWLVWLNVLSTSLETKES